MIKALIFDFGQTLVDSAEGFRKAEAQVQQKVFGVLSNFISWDMFISTYRLERKRYKDSSNLSKRIMWQEIIHHFHGHIDEEQLIEWETEYWDTVTAYTKQFPEAEQVLQKLSTQFKLAMITNAQGQADDSSHRVITQFSHLAEYFEVIIIAGSKDIPPKPNPKPFELCLSQLQMNEDEVVFVGDDWYIDIQGALHKGITPIWIKHHLVKRNWPDGDDAVQVITSLNDLLDQKLFG